MKVSYETLLNLIEIAHNAQRGIIDVALVNKTLNALNEGQPSIFRVPK